MANPLAILGGLATVGSQGAGGALEGQVIGEDLRRKYASEDQLNQLRVLETFLKGQQIQQATRPTSDIAGDRIVNREYPHGPVTSVNELPETTGQRAVRQQHEASTAYQGAHAAQLGKPTDPTQIWQARLAEALASGNGPAAEQATAILNRFAEIHSRQGAPRTHFQTATDARGNMTGLVYTQKPDGNWKVDQIPFGPIGHAPGGGGGAGVPRETVTDDVKFVPRKPITDQNTLNQINASIQMVVDDLSRKPGFNNPTGFVTGPSGKAIRKEDVIAYAFRERFGKEITVRWDGKRKFILVNAWEPETREKIQRRRTTGPPGTTPFEQNEEPAGGEQ